MSFDINTVKRISSPLGEDARQHQRVVKIRMLFCFSRQMIAGDSLITEIAKGLEAVLGDVSAKFRRVEVTNSACDGGFDHGGLESHNGIAC